MLSGKLFLSGGIVFAISALCSYAQASDDDEADLDTVTVNAGATDRQLHIIENSGLNVDVIDTDEYLNLSKDINQVLNTTPGIIIRNSGGLGSRFKLSLNGLSEKQIRYFIDGVPMENFGDALSVDNYPVNIVERLDVFKGVVPIHLSSDALGGAINIITPSLTDSYLDTSVSYGSFNTTRVALSGQYSKNNRYFSRISSFWNSSDNDYEMKELPEKDKFNNLTGGTVSEKRFHDEYQSRMLAWENGIINADWADKLSLSLTYADSRNNFQHPGESIDVVYGGLYSRSNSKLASANYKKDWGDTFLQAYLLGGKTETTYYDTETRSYQWDGSFTENSGNRAEASEQPSILDINDKVVRSNIYARHELNKQFSVAAAISFNRLARSGGDRLFERNDRFDDPQSINKIVSALDFGYQGIGSGSVFYKHYQMKATTSDRDINDGSEIDNEVNESDNGFGFSYQYQPYSFLTLLASGERAVRLPESYELMGDGIFVRPNPQLEPETSNNFNAGIKVNLSSDSRNYSAESNFFVRKAKDFIRYNADRINSGIYENLQDVDIQGVELSGAIEGHEAGFISASVTYQDLINRTRADANSEDHDGDRVPNEPYFFGSLKGGYSIFDSQYNEYALYWTSRYVHEYFLHWESSGNSDEKNKIDQQVTHDLELSASFSDQSIHASFSINNLTDATVYDNYNIQKPGRAYFLKLRYNY